MTAQGVGDQGPDGAPSGARSVGAGGVQHPGADVTLPVSVTTGGVPSDGDPGRDAALITMGDGTVMHLDLPRGAQGPPAVQTPAEVMARIRAAQDVHLAAYLDPERRPGDRCPVWLVWVLVWIIFGGALSLSAWVLWS